MSLFAALLVALWDTPQTTSVLIKQRVTLHAHNILEYTFSVDVENISSCNFGVLANKLYLKLFKLIITVEFNYSSLY